MTQMENTYPPTQEKATDDGVVTSPTLPTKKMLKPTEQALAATEQQTRAMQQAHLALLRTWLQMAPDMRLTVQFDEGLTTIEVSGWLS